MACKPKKTEIIAAEPPAAPAVVKTVKGFDRNLKCRGFQFEVGKTYSVEGPVVVCKNGWHACENPLDVFGYYSPGLSVFHEVEQGGDLARHDEDTKIASATITIGVEISLHEMALRAVDWIKSKIDFSNAPSTNTGDQSAATNTGDQSAATNAGDQSAATNTGDQSAATNTGDQSAATNTGDQSAATNTGYQSAATNTGYRSAATNTGDQSAATNTGNQSAATNTGNHSAATNTGYQSAATNTGYQSAAEVRGKNSVAIAIGFASRARASADSAICLVCRDDDGDILAIRASKVGENGVKPDVWYSLNASGEFVEETE
jgi:hypothetical protein